MESFMRELAEKGGLDLDARDDVGRDPAISAAWEAMLVEEMDKMQSTAPASTSTTSTSQEKCSTPPASTSTPEPAKPSAAAGDEFQSRIRNAMNKLKSSESSFDPPAAPPLTFAGSDDQSFATLMKGLEELGPGEGEELTGVLEAMMGQLMSKDILYEPLKELDEKFPSYLASHPALPEEDKKRYEKQRSCITQLLTIFEGKGYNEEDAKSREKIAEIMGEVSCLPFARAARLSSFLSSYFYYSLLTTGMFTSASQLQSYGSPPEEIMGPLPPGTAMGADGLPELPEGCVVS
ncbi:Pex19 protein family-domain-containing protein [Pisolithus marmoratus]|nr:Pex19 protein family-domain-containing protein [Pisolithus marmoratus]